MNNKYDDTSEDGKASQELVQCSACLRQMRQEVFAKHPNVCRKNPANKRNVHVFNMTQYRSIRAEDKITTVCKISSSTNSNKSNNINIRPSQTRSAKRDRRSDAPIPPIIDNFCCPICKRTFCEKAYDRHVEFCTSKIKQIQQPPSEEILLARLKLNRRIKFHSNRVCSTLPSISNCATNKTASKSSQPLRKKHSLSLAHCPWCSKPYLPNCVHYCQNSKEFVSLRL